jgi:hypothetical protein
MVTFHRPGAQVGHLTSLGAEGAPGVAFPRTGLMAERADHARIVPRCIRKSVGSQLGRILGEAAICSNLSKRR